MNIAIIGYGKMGKIIEKISKKRGHNIIIKTSKTPTKKDLKKSEVAIEFSTPKSAVNNIKICLKNKIPIISGTTGWENKIDIIKNICKKTKGSFLYSSNFSIGVNIFFEINKKLANIMKKNNEYKIYIKEIHHKDKIDIPSGTAIKIAQDIIEKNSKIKKWTLNTEKYKKEEIPIIVERKKNEIGTHIVIYKSKIDNIKIKHNANNRKGFGLGAVIAAEWIKNKKGFFTMKDVLDL